MPTPCNTKFYKTLEFCFRICDVVCGHIRTHDDAHKEVKIVRFPEEEQFIQMLKNQLS